MVGLEWGCSRELKWGRIMRLCLGGACMLVVVGVGVAVKPIPGAMTQCMDRGASGDEKIEWDTTIGILCNK
jgi:hypothetical protein